jgi:hypothetical protein
VTLLSQLREKTSDLLGEPVSLQRPQDVERNAVQTLVQYAIEQSHDRVDAGVGEQPGSQVGQLGREPVERERRAEAVEQGGDLVGGAVLEQSVEAGR